jgi:hypothetical protein
VTIKNQPVPFSKEAPMTTTTIMRTTENPTYELSLEKPRENPWNTFAIFMEGQIDATKKVKFDFITGMIAKLDPRDRQPTIVPVDRYTLLVTEQVRVTIHKEETPPNATSAEECSHFFSCRINFKALPTYQLVDLDI